MRERLAQMAARAEIFGCFPEKEARRGRDLDALGFWHAFILAPLVEALRMRWCPERSTFGLRYLDRDLPSETVARLKLVAFVPDGADILAKSPVARRWLAQAIREAHPHA